MSHATYTPTLLYVEDDEAIAWAFESITREKNCNLIVVIASNRDDAMSVLSKTKPHQNVDSPDLILLDLDLPGANGFQIFHEIRGLTEFAAVPVVFFSSSERPADRQLAIRMGAAAYIHKPMDLDGFSDAIDQICEFISAAHRDFGILDRPVGT